MKVPIKHRAKVAELWESFIACPYEKDGKKALQIPCVNLTYVSGDPRKVDENGRQLERDATSNVHRSDNSADANCWVFPDEA